MATPVPVSLAANQRPPCSFFPAVLTDANYSSEESHRDATSNDPALSQPESPPGVSIDKHFSLFHLNPRGINTKAKRALFDGLLQHLQQPTIVGVTETWLSRTTDALTFANYKRVSILDRRVGREDCGGIALFARDDFFDSVVHVGDMNVHNIEWLKHSNSNSKEGIELKAVCVVRTD